MRSTHCQVVLICVLTSYIKTHFSVDVSCAVPHSVAALVSTCDGSEGDVFLTDADTILVALPGGTHCSK